MTNHHPHNRPPKRKEVRLEPISLKNSHSLSSSNSQTHQQSLDDIREKIEELRDEQEEQHSTHPVAPQEPTHSHGSTAAASVIRRKIDRLYAKEPDTLDEAIESFQAKGHRSKHQQFMYDLSVSGKSLAEIQTAWHAYYIALPDSEKHEVWQEFYSAHGTGIAAISHHTEQSKHTTTAQQTHHVAPMPHNLGISQPNEQKTVAELKQRVLHKVSAGGKLRAKHHLQSLLFGLGMASIVLVLFLFSFFNERFIAPFISPSKQVSATPIVGNSGVVGPEPKIIIPKINVEVPVVYDLGSTEEKVVQAGLENGVVHYATSPLPGQTGNVVIVGHSSNNILNKGKYKFAFVLLKNLEVGDTFSVHKDSVRYTYQIFEKKVVKPTDVSVLGATAKPNTVTLITCDPPGTSLNRLIIVAEQISPDPSGNTVVEQQAPQLTDKGILPSNAPSLWQRIKNLF